MLRAALVLALFVTGCGPLVVADGGVDASSGFDAGSNVSNDAGSTNDAGATDAGTATDAGVRTTLRVTYPTGTNALFVRGSLPPLNWNTGVPMQKVNDTTWTLALDGLASGAALEWKPLLNDMTWSKGPNYEASGGGTTEVAPRFLRDAGEWTIRWPSFASTILGNTRGVYVYLPPTYLENSTARMPVVYMHDGQNLFDPAAAFGGVTWRVPEAMNDAASNGRFREAIVVGAENAGAGRIGEYTPTSDPMYGGGRGDLFLRMLVEELKPRVDLELRTLTGPADTVLIGSSLGGLISSYAGVRKADTFGCIGAMSPSVWWDGRVLLTYLPQTPASARPLRVYVDSGDSGPSNDGVTDTADLVVAYRALGYTDGATLKYVVQQGATHTESAWASRLPGALEFLLGPGR
ncbi:MAG: alpha/beta hydrolase [Archangium sp.]|nr:alpha/beta hydrolase [Archangium sp.]